MNSNIIEIINIIIKKMLTRRHHPIDKDELNQELKNNGYEYDDIQKALGLIFSGKEIINGKYIGTEDLDKTYNRIFTFTEKMYLSVKIQGLILRLMILNVLTPEQSEILITRVLQGSYRSQINIDELWNILNDIIEDDAKLNIISREISEFNNFFNKGYKYIN